MLGALDHRDAAVLSLPAKLESPRTTAGPDVAAGRVDSTTGQLNGWIEREWDFDVDGFP